MKHYDFKSALNQVEQWSGAKPIWDGWPTIQLALRIADRLQNEPSAEMIAELDYFLHPSIRSDTAYLIMAQQLIKECE